MSKLVSWKRGSDIEPLNEGVHTAVIAAVQDMGIQPGFEGQKPRPEFAVCLEFEDRIKDGPNIGKRRALWITVSASLHEKSKLGGIVKALGYDLPTAQRDGFDMDWLTAKCLQVGIEHDVKGDRRYPRASSFYKMPAGVQPLVPERPVTEPLPDFLAERRNLATAGAVASPASNTPVAANTPEPLWKKA
jgi:hypothetical protein